uniref:Vacuolar fusion protein MON1 homolog n=1 Tax=Araucaria cunninghamii TaxID=56994 RepID=A0A0D6R108_ARACU
MARESYPLPLDCTSAEEFYESYEDLFEEEDWNSGPCYLPEKNHGVEANGEFEKGIGKKSDLTVSVETDGRINPKMEGNGVLNEGQDEEERTLSIGQIGHIEEQNPLNKGKIERVEEQRDFDADQIEAQSATSEGPVSEKTIMTEDGVSEAENGSGISSNGYEAGTSNGVSVASTVSSVIGDVIMGQFNDRSGAEWMPGKGHENEDDTSITWRKRKKHFFILSHAGKPIFTRYGDENKLAGFSATLQAIISFVENTGDNIKLVQAGNHQIVFSVKGPIYLVCISCTEEPFQALRVQLEFLYGQMLLILTNSIEKYFRKNAKFDMRPLLGGTDVVFSSLIHAFTWNPATFLHAYTCVPLPYATRQAAGGILQDIVDSQILFAILMCRHKVISIAGAQKATLHPDDILLLSNFIVSTESFRTSESFSPICLPRYNPTAFLHAYVQYLKDDSFLVVLTTDSNGFYRLRDCRIQVESVLNNSNVLSEVKRSMSNAGLRVENLPCEPTLNSVHGGQGLNHRHDLAVSVRETKRHTAGIGGPGGLWHFMYKSIYLDQYVASEFSPPLNGHRAQKRLLRAYENLYASMHTKPPGPHKMQYRRDENYILLCWITPDFELYSAFDPLAEKSVAIAVCNRVCQWLRDLENEIFFIGAGPFSW